MTYRIVHRRRVRTVRCLLWAGYVGVAGALLVGMVAANASWLSVGVAAAVVATGLIVLDRWMRDEGGVPVLFYHSINDTPDWLPWPSCVVSLETFERHLRMLRYSSLNVVRTADLLDARRNGFPLPPRPVVLHFDDGYLDNWTAVMPLLQRYDIPATLFVSLDFIEQGDTLRPTLADCAAGRVSRADLSWQGYVNWREIEAMDRSGLVDIQPHGVDHGRVETGPDIEEYLSPENWTRLVWVQWRRMAGPKVDWLSWSKPLLIPVGAPVRVSAPALAAQAWDERGGRESRDAYEARVRDHLSRAKRELEVGLGRAIDVFCWPENGTSAEARRIAAEVGFRATTAGQGQNRADEDPQVISRIGISDRRLGWYWPAAEAAILYAEIRVFHGNYYWFYLLLAAAVVRRLFGLLAWRPRSAS